MTKIYPKGVVAQLKQLNAITTGPAAVRVPTSVQDISLKFSRDLSASTTGVHALRKKYLPPIAFYNPQLSIKVERTADQAAPSIKVSFSDGTTKTLDASHEPADALLEQLKEITKAEQIAENEQIRLGEQ